jgi:hypothetical protein
MAGYEAIGKNAEALSKAIEDGDGPFERPDDDTHDADHESYVTARRAAFDAFTEASDAVRTEDIWTSDRIQDLGGNSELASYAATIRVHKAAVDRLVQRLDKLWDDLDSVEERYLRNPAGGAIAFHEYEIISQLLKADAELLARSRPQEPWDVDYVELKDGNLQLLPEYFGRGRTRSTFYPSEYWVDTMNRALATTRTRTDHHPYPKGPLVTFWEYRDERSPRNDYWWLMDDSRECLTLDHKKPTVVAHWNKDGRATNQADRRSFYNFAGQVPKAVPKTVNSRDGAREKDRYTRFVLLSFRGR